MKNKHVNVRECYYKFLGVLGPVLVSLFMVHSVNALNSNSSSFTRISEQYADVADAPVLDVSDSITVEAWVKLDTQPAVDDQEYAIVAKYNNDINDRSYYFRYFNESGTWYLGALTSADGFNFDNGEVEHTLPVGEWVHVAFVCTNGALEIYADEVEIGSTHCMSSFHNSDAALSIGAVANNSSIHHFDGKIDEVRVWNVARNGAEIAADMNRELTGTEPNLVGYWKLNGDYADSTGNGNDLTPVNGPGFSTDVPFTDAPPPPPAPAAEQAQNLINVVLAYELPVHIEHSYLANLKKLPKFIEDGKKEAALNQLFAFGYKVLEDKASGEITAEIADELIALGDALGLAMLAELN